MISGYPVSGDQPLAHQEGPGIHQMTPEPPPAGSLAQGDCQDLRKVEGGEGRLAAWGLSSPVDIRVGKMLISLQKSPLGKKREIVEAGNWKPEMGKEQYGICPFGFSSPRSGLRRETPGP